MGCHCLLQLVHTGCLTKVVFFYFIHFYFWLCGCCMGFSLVAKSGGYSLVAVRGILVAVASLAAEHRLYGTQASAVAAPRL